MTAASHAAVFQPWPGHILPAAVAIAVGGCTGPAPPAFPLEQETARGFAPGRRREFLWGRHYAREALARLGVAAEALARTPDRSLRWPVGTVGSISHCHGFCVAAAARQRDIVALGLDVECATPLPSSLHASICTDAELAQAATALGDTGRAAKLLFSVKESVYKAYAPATRSFLRFLDVVVAIDGVRGCFVAEIINPALPDLLGRRELAGRFAHGDGLVYAICAVPASAGSASPSIASTSSSLKVSTKLINCASTIVASASTVNRSNAVCGSMRTP